MTDEEESILANLRPCINGPISSAAEGDMVSGRAALYPSTRAVHARIIETHRRRPGPATQVDEQARVFNLIQRLVGLGRTRESAIRQARSAFAAFVESDEAAFDAACAVKPHSRIRKRANEINGGRVTCPPLRDSQSAIP